VDARTPTKHLSLHQAKKAQGDGLFESGRKLEKKSLLVRLGFGSGQGKQTWASLNPVHRPFGLGKKGGNWEINLNSEEKNDMGGGGHIRRSKQWFV